jgi:hypothetical protein
MKHEWFYDSAAFNTDKPVLYLALLTVLRNGEAIIYVEQQSYSFSSEDEAQFWLTDEEFTAIEYMLEDCGMLVIAPTLLPM